MGQGEAFPVSPTSSQTEFSGGGPAWVAGARNATRKTVRLVVGLTNFCQLSAKFFAAKCSEGTKRNGRRESLAVSWGVGGLMSCRPPRLFFSRAVRELAWAVAFPGLQLMPFCLSLIPAPGLAGSRRVGGIKEVSWWGCLGNSRRTKCVSFKPGSQRSCQFANGAKCFVVAAGCVGGGALGSGRDELPPSPVCRANL